MKTTKSFLINDSSGIFTVKKKRKCHTSRKLGCFDKKCGDEGLSSSESESSDTTELLLGDVKESERDNLDKPPSSF